MSTFLQDLRFAFRNLRKTPAFPLAAIATLALGIGATTAIFSTVNAVLLRPLPYPHAEDLYGIRTTLTDGRVTTGMLAANEVLRLNAPNLSIERAAGLQQFDVTLLQKDGTPKHAFVYGVSEGFFELFGLPMALGGFTHDQFITNGPPVAVISYRIWQDMFQGDPAIVGKPLRFAEVTATITGVAPKAFDTPHDADFWFNVGLDPQGVGHVFDGFMRLKRGTNVDRAKSEMGAVMAGLAHDFPASALNRAYVVRPLVESIVGDLGSILLIVLSATALLLILACVNVTNLLLARGATRAREIAVRVALGAGRRQIVRQLLTESLVLAAAGALLGLLIASAGVRLLLSIGASRLPRLDAVPFDGRVLLFALSTVIVSGVLVGFAPALRLAGTDVRTLMNEGGRSGGAGRGTSRWLNAMTAAEIALAITLVAGAGWLIRGFANLQAINPGFAADRRLVFDITFQGPKYPDPASVTAGTTDLFERLRALPGVAAVGSTTNLPLRNTPENSVFVQLKGETLDPVHPLQSRQRGVSPGFFSALGVGLVTGRDFTVDDRRGTQGVAVVNRTFVHRNLADRDPIGAQFLSGYPAINPNSEVTVIGVVEDVRQRTLVDAAEPAYYTPMAQGGPRRQTVVVQSKVPNTAPLQTSIREEVRKTDPLIAIDFELVTDIVDGTLRRQQLGMTLMLLFGAAAAALAAVGIYGVVAYAASERRGEMATRLALGAAPGNVFWLVLKQGCILAGIGTAIGLGVAYGSGRLVSSYVFGVKASDPIILSAATGLVVAVALLATTIPAYRSSRLDPARVLRPES